MIDVHYQLIIAMIRHTVSLRADPELQEGRLGCCLQGIQDNDCIKLTQFDRVIYLTYRLSESMAEKHAPLPL